MQVGNTSSRKITEVKLNVGHSLHLDTGWPSVEVDDVDV